MSDSRHTDWSRQLNNLTSEISRLCIVCDVDMREPNLAERVLRDDESVCRRKNTRVFQTLRKHVMAFYLIEDGAIKRLGADDVLPMLDEIRVSITWLHGVEK